MSNIQMVIGAVGGLVFGLVLIAGVSAANIIALTTGADPAVMRWLVVLAMIAVYLGIGIHRGLIEIPESSRE